jgi:hypothetical protein
MKSVEPEISLKELSRISTKDFRKRTTTIDSAIQIDRRNGARFADNGATEVLPAEFTFQFNQIYKDRFRRRISVAVGNDVVDVLLKPVQMFHAVYLRVDGIPFSNSRIHDNEMKVLQTLADRRLCEKAMVSANESKILDAAGYPVESSHKTHNFVSFLPQRLEHFNRSKWRSKNGVNISKSLEGFGIERVTPTNLNLMNRIAEMWTDWKDENHEVRAKNLAKGVKRFISANPSSDDCIYYILRYGDLPIGFAVYVIDGNGIAHQIVNKALSHTNHQPANEIEEKLKRHSGRLVYYYTLTELEKLGVNTVFFGGVFSQKSLAEHKAIMTDQCISSFTHQLIRQKNSRTQKPIGETQMNTVQLVQPALSPKVQDYVERISASWQNAVESILSVGALLKEAEASLTDEEWFDLLSDLPFNPTAADRLLAIANDKRLNNPKNTKYLPPHWTTLYTISTLPDDAFKTGIKEGLISSAAKRSDIVVFKNEFEADPASAVQSATQSIASSNSSIRLASLSVPTKFDLNDLPSLRKSLVKLSSQYGIELQFDGSKSGVIVLERENLAVETENWLGRHTKTYNKNVSQSEIDTIEDTFFQLKNGREYHPDPKTGMFVDQDIRSPNHLFFGNSLKDMYDYCRKKKIITQFTRIKELDKTAYVKELVLLHSRGDARKRAEAKKGLLNLVNRGNAESQAAATEALDMLIEFGA